jgi:glycosyltransferase involved in cell wall biosynthesis
VNPPTAPISVVIPAFNAASFIGTALATIAAQTLAPAEVIVVDDGSTDDTASVAEARGAHVLRVAHVGLSEAKNAGIAAASQEWIAILDADDVWHSRKLELQWDVVTREPRVDLVVTDFDEISAAGEMLVADGVVRLRQYRGAASERIGSSASLCDSSALAELLPKWDFVLQSALLMRTSIARIGFNGGLHAEDVDFVLRALTTARMAVVELPLVGYVRHPSQMTATWEKDAVMLQLCEHVIANAANYRPESVRAFRDVRLEMHVRFAYGCLRRGELARGIGGVARALRSGLAVRGVASLVMRGALKVGLLRSVLLLSPRVRRLLSGIPVRDASVPGGRVLPFEIPWRAPRGGYAVGGGAP